MEPFPARVGRVLFRICLSMRACTPAKRNKKATTPKQNQTTEGMTIPHELWLKVFEDLDFKSLVFAGLTCHEWNQLANEPSLWYEQFFSFFFFFCFPLFPLPLLSLFPLPLTNLTFFSLSLSCFSKGNDFVFKFGRKGGIG